MEQRHYVDFEIIKEGWDVYNLHDGTKIKIRNMLRLAWFTKGSQGEKKYSTDVSTDIVFMCEPNLQGEKNQTQFTPDQLQKNIDVENCRYDTLRYEPTEYLLDGNIKLLIHSNILSIARTKLFDSLGDRIYLVENDMSANLMLPPQ